MVKIIRRYWKVIGLTLIGAFLAMWGPLTASAKGMILGGTLAFALIELTVIRLSNRRLADVLPKDVGKRRRTVLVCGLLATVVMFATLWPATDAFVTDQGSFMVSFITIILFVISGMVAVMAAGVSLMKGGIYKE